MKYGSINLEAVYQTIRSAYNHSLEPPTLPERHDAAYIAYRKSYKGLLKTVSMERAVYFWYAKLRDNSTEYIYVGESHNSKKGLRGRLDDEFRRSYHGFWSTVFDTEKYLPEAIRIFGDKTKYNPKKSYENDIKNDFERRGASHIVYFCGLPDDHDLLTIQNDLIQLFDNPRGNKKDKRSTPFPADRLLPISKQIYSEFFTLLKAEKLYEF